MPSTLDWLRGRSDDELAELLIARPDLVLPAPPNLTALARRMDSSGAARRALSHCDAFEVQLLQALWILGGDGPTAHDDMRDTAQSHDRGSTVAELGRLLGGPATDAEIATAIARLHAVGLVRVDGDTVALAPGVATALGPYPAGLGPAAGMPADAVRAALAETTDDDQALLRRLVPGPPVGTVEPDSPHRSAIDRLVAAGLLIEQSNRAVLLPREVALALRGDRPLGPAAPHAPELVTRRLSDGAADGAAAGQALAAHARAVRVLELLGEAPAPALKSGGIGVVALRSIAKELDLDTSVVAVYLEVLHASGLIAPAVSPASTGASWMPTQTADAFLAGSEAAGWALLATTWLDMRRDPARVGGRDANDKVVNVLSPPVDWRTGSAERRAILREMAATAADLAVDRASLLERLRFASPLRTGDALADRVNSVMAEATELGVVAFDALPTPGRVLLDEDAETVASSLAEVLPAPVDSVLVQADMTIVAPGRLTPELATALAQVADVESSGSATVYRLSEASIRRALDAGVTRSELHELIENHSATPVPQSVTYLVDDVARQHGVLRAGAASAFVHSDDPGLVAQAVAAAGHAGITLRPLAPTVAVSPIDVTTLVEALRSAGLAPAAEDASGLVLDLRPQPFRTRSAVPPRPRPAEPTPPTRQQISSIVARMRAGDASQAGAVDPRDILPLLREAARARTAVWIGYADAEGATSTRVVEPIVVSGGTMVAYDRLRQAPRTFTIHRVVSVTAAPPEADG